jgi:hypothetical protein
MTLISDIFGLPIPNAGPVFDTALVIHILSGLTAVTAGALAATARKRPGRHPRAGRVYLWALGGVFTTATMMAIIRWHEDAHLFAIAVVAFSLGLYGYRARRRHGPGWPPHHAVGMGGLLYRPTHRLLRRQRTLPAPMGPATPPHLLAPAKSYRHPTHLACATTLPAPASLSLVPTGFQGRDGHRR